MLKTVALFALCLVLATCFSGRAASQEELQLWDGGADSFLYAFSMQALGDFDEDTVEEIGVAFLDQNFSVQFDVLSGQSGAVLRSIPVGTGHGVAAMARAGDVDGDGTQDFLYTDTSIMDRTVHVVSGATYQIVHSHSRPVPLFVLDFYGRFLAGGQDVDGDGFSDYLIDDPFHHQSHVHSGQTGQVLYSILGDRAGMVFLRDVDADGHGDFALQLSETVVVHSGINGQQLYSVSGLGADGFGSAIEEVEDLDGDSIVEILVAAPYADFTATDSGSVYVFSGADGSLLGRLDAPVGVTSYGVGLDRAGDVNGDGFEDFLVQTDSTTVGPYLISGRDLDLLYVWESSDTDHYDGLAALGDVNGDGLGDVAMAQPMAGLGQISVRAGNEIFLLAPDSVAVSSDLSLRLAGGAPNRLSVLFLEAVNGTPFFYHPRPLSVLDAKGSHQDTLLVPQVPIELRFRSFALDQNMQVVDSAGELVNVE
jgi:hypothetical protein